MSSNQIISILLVMLTIGVAFCSSGCTQEKPGDRIKSFLLPYVENLVVGFIIRFRVEIHINASPPIDDGTTTYRDYTVSCKVVSSSINEASSCLTPVTHEATTYPALANWINPDSTVGYMIWGETVATWEGQRYSTGGLPNITVTQEEPDTPGTGDQLLPKPAKMMTLTGFEFNVDDLMTNPVEQARKIIPIPTLFRFNILQEGKSAFGSFAEPLITEIDQWGNFQPYTYYDISMYCPIGGNIIKNIPIEVDFYECSQVWQIGWTTEAFSTPNWAWLVVPLVAACLIPIIGYTAAVIVGGVALGIYLWNTVSSWFGWDLEVHFFKLDTATIPYLNAKAYDLNKITDNLRINLQTLDNP
jgi:hypothetical protein